MIRLLQYYLIGLLQVASENNVTLSIVSLIVVGKYMKLAVYW